MRSLSRMEWDHPHVGRISEPVCRKHESEVLRALRVLGIGCGGTTEREATACLRCSVPQNEPPRVFLRRQFGDVT